MSSLCHFSVQLQRTFACFFFTFQSRKRCTSSVCSRHVLGCKRMRHVKTIARQGGTGFADYFVVVFDAHFSAKPGLSLGSGLGELPKLMEPQKPVALVLSTPPALPGDLPEDPKPHEWRRLREDWDDTLHTSTPTSPFASLPGAPLLARPRSAAGGQRPGSPQAQAFKPQQLLLLCFCIVQAGSPTLAGGLSPGCRLEDSGRRQGSQAELRSPVT